jgi:hypothetical protein
MSAIRPYQFIRFFIFLICLISGCVQQPRDQYFPLQGGKYWRYVMSYKTMDGTFKGIYAVENLAQAEKNEELLFVRKLLDGSLNFFRMTDQGILFIAREKTIDLKTEYTEDSHYIFQFPLQVGTEWQDTTISKALIKTGPPQKTEFHIVARVPVTARIDSMTDTVKVPAGTFKNCMRVNISGDAFTNAGNYVGMTIVRINETNWYAPGVGLVKSLRNESTKSKALDKGEITLELESYNR